MTDQSDPVHEAIMRARTDCERTAGDLLWLGMADRVEGNNVKPGERMSDVWPERFEMHRRICGRD